jgi:hypothetical protein
MSRQVYAVEDLERLAAVEGASPRGWPYVPTDRKVTLGQVFRHVDRNVQALAHHPMTVWEFRPDLYRPPAPWSEFEGCIFLGCARPPRYRFEPSARGARSKRVCELHLPGLVAADKYGNQSEASPVVSRLDSAAEV